MILIRRLLYLLLVTCAAFAAHVLFFSSQSYWLVWSVFSFSLITAGTTFFERLSIIAFTGLMTAIVVFITGALAFSGFLLTSFLFLIIYSFLAFSDRYPRYHFSVLIICLFAILASLDYCPFVVNLQRLFFICGGGLIVIICQCVYGFYFQQDKSRHLLHLSLKHFASLNEAIFSCFRYPQYASDPYWFERKIHMQKYNLLQEMSGLDVIKEHNAQKLNQRKTLMISMKDLFAIMLDYAQLRYRVTEHANFQLCIHELNAISQAIDKLFQTCNLILKQKKSVLDTSEFAIAIQRLEENYQAVLQIAVSEPLVFLLFITSLKTMLEKIETFYSALRALYRCQGERA